MPASPRVLTSRTVVLIAVALVTASTASAQEPAAAAPAPAEAATAPLRLPAAFYDVVGVWDLGWGDAPGRGRPAARAAVATQRVVRGPNGQTVVRNVPAPIGPPATSRFMLAADSVLYRRGSDWAEFAVADITAIEEVRWPAASATGWVAVSYVKYNIEETVYFRQTNAMNQATLLATFRHALDVSRARDGTARE
jgi:hypothetical protein